MVYVTKHPYMTSPERVTFKQLVKTGEISFFRIGTCQHAGCAENVPKNGDKKYCCEECFRKEEDHGRKANEEEESW